MTEQRTAILTALRSSRSGLDAATLAERLALHPNTIRWHLGVLGRDGLVVSHPEHRDRGRPAIVYQLSADGIVHDRDEYRLLATMLTAAVASGPDGAARAYETGVTWGRAIAPADGDVVTLLDEQGFAATQDGETIEMRRCPFFALAAGNPEVICTLHHGLIDGALADSGYEVGELRPFVEPALCIARLRSGEQA